MAKDKVKKGFAFYLMMFILILVAAFMIIVTIMLFSPQKSILGFKYFSFSDSEQIVKTADEKDINFSTLSTIQINSNSATVNILKSNVEKDTIEIVNKCIGFAKADQNTQFSREIELKDGVLKINVVEPEGFLFFSQDFQINILVPAETGVGSNKTTNPYQLSNVKFVVTTQSGDVNIGSSTSDKQESSAYNTITPKNIAIKTEAGNIKLNKYCEGKFNTLSLVTEAGAISSDVEINISSPSQSKIATSNGRIALSAINTTNSNWTPVKNLDLNLNLGNGSFIADKIDGSLSLVVANGSLSVKEITGDFSANNTKDSIGSPKINLNTVGGDVSVPFGNNAEITIGEVKGYTNIDLNGGKVDIGGTKGLSQKSWISSKSGNINAVVADTIAGVSHTFESVSGSINVNYLAPIISTNTIKSQTGNINFNIKSGYKFMLEVRSNNGEYIQTLSDKVSFEFIDAKEYKMPFGVHDYQGRTNYVLLQTDGQIRGKLMSIA